MKKVSPEGEMRSFQTSLQTLNDFLNCGELVYGEFCGEHIKGGRRAQTSSMGPLVDDVFSICKKKNVECFLHYLNSRDQNIHFTLELEQNGEMPFLDVWAQRTVKEKIKTGVHRKATHSGRILAFDSHHPVSA